MNDDKDRFLAFVFAGALAQDLANDTTDAQSIARIAADIPPEKIPCCPRNAAAVFLNYMRDPRARPFKWMLLTTSEPATKPGRKRCRESVRA